VGEEYLDLLAFLARRSIGFSVRKRARNIAVVPFIALCDDLGLL